MALCSFFSELIMQQSDIKNHVYPEKTIKDFVKQSKHLLQPFLAEAKDLKFKIQLARRFFHDKVNNKECKDHEQAVQRWRKWQNEIQDFKNELDSSLPTFFSFFFLQM